MNVDFDTVEDVQMEKVTDTPSATAQDPLASELTDPLEASADEGAGGDAVQMGRNYLH